MGNSLRITLRGGERLFINGAVLKADRKVGLELLNGATFLLEQHFMTSEEAKTPLSQLYFLVQTMLVEPAMAGAARAAAEAGLAGLAGLSVASQDSAMRDGLKQIEALLKLDRPVDVLKKIRALLPLERAEVAPPVAGASVMAGQDGKSKIAG